MTPDPNARTHEGAHLRKVPAAFLCIGNPNGTPLMKDRVFAIFYQEPVDLHDLAASCDERDTPDIASPGWYWDDEDEHPEGPFRTSALAYVDATKGNYP